MITAKLKQKRQLTQRMGNINKLADNNIFKMREDEEFMVEDSEGDCASPISPKKQYLRPVRQTKIS